VTVCVYVEQALGFNDAARPSSMVLARFVVTGIFHKNKFIELKTVCTTGYRFVIDGEVTVLMARKG
jgi:hypothetical protein